MHLNVCCCLVYDCQDSKVTNASFRMVKQYLYVHTWNRMQEREMSYQATKHMDETSMHMC